MDLKTDSNADNISPISKDSEPVQEQELFAEQMALSVLDEDVSQSVLDVKDSEGVVGGSYTKPESYFIELLNIKQAETITVIQKQLDSFRDVFSQYVAHTGIRMDNEHQATELRFSEVTNQINTVKEDVVAITDHLVVLQDQLGRLDTNHEDTNEKLSSIGDTVVLMENKVFLLEKKSADNHKETLDKVNGLRSRIDKMSLEQHSMASDVRTVKDQLGKLEAYIPSKHVDIAAPVVNTVASPEMAELKHEVVRIVEYTEGERPGMQVVDKSVIPEHVTVRDKNRRSSLTGDAQTGQAVKSNEDFSWDQALSMQESRSFQEDMVRVLKDAVRVEFSRARRLSSGGGAGEPDDDDDGDDDPPPRRDLSEGTPMLGRRRKSYSGDVKRPLRGHYGDDSDDDGRERDDDVAAGIAALNPRRRTSRQVLDLTHDNIMAKTGATIQSIATQKMPTISDLCLNTFAVPNVLAFKTKFDRLQQEFPKTLKMALYLSSETYTTLETEAKRFTDIADRLGDLGVLDRGEQMLTNDEVWEIIRWCTQPKSKDQFEEVLAQSVWPRASFEKFEHADYTHKHLHDYMNQVKVYNKRFDELLQLIVGKETRQWLPERVDGGSGKSSSKDMGMVQYYFQGFPNPQVAWRIWKRRLTESQRKLATHSFDEFRNKFLDVLDKLEKEHTRSEGVAGLFDLKRDTTAPKRQERFETKKSKYRASVNNVYESAHRSREWYDDYDDRQVEEDELPNADSYLDSDEGYATGQEEAQHKESSVPTDHDGADPKGEPDGVEDDSDDWLIVAFVDAKDPDNKKNLPCFKFAKTGRCEFGEKCSYSHEKDVMDKYKAIKKIGPNGFNRIRYNNVETRAGAKASIGEGQTHKPFQKPTSILRRGPGEGARRSS